MGYLFFVVYIIFSSITSQQLNSHFQFIQAAVSHIALTLVTTQAAALQYHFEYISQCLLGVISLHPASKSTKGKISSSFFIGIGER